MRGIILAGGTGSRLYPLTAVTNKHLLPIGNLPMIEYPLYTLRSLKIDSISIVTGGEHFKEIAGYFGAAHPEIVSNLSFHYQNEPRGIPHAIACTEKFVSDSSIAVALGDNIFEDCFYEAAKNFEKSGFGTMIFLKKVHDAHRFGVVEIKDGKVISLEEKPPHPKSDLAITGLYFFDRTVFDKIRTLKPSPPPRSELEVTELIRLYVEEGRACFSVIDGYWTDAGKPEVRRRAEEFVLKGLEEKVLESSGIKLSR